MENVPSNPETALVLEVELKMLTPARGSCESLSKITPVSAL